MEPFPGVPKKFIGEDKKEAVTYLVSASNGYCFPDEFLPQNDYRAGGRISVPVNFRAFARKNDRLDISFTVRKDYGITLSSEDF